jgi:hypothetical protein
MYLLAAASFIACQSAMAMRRSATNRIPILEKYAFHMLQQQLSVLVFDTVDRKAK